MDIERVQRDGLRRKRVVALGLLLAMAALFLITLVVPSPGFWVLMVQASAEAALIGGLADWFAVTALFRRPLGLPIPHTAIVPSNKDRIGEGLAAFLERNFLSHEITSSTVRSADPARNLALWLLVQENANLFADQILRLLPHLVKVADDRKIRAFFAETFKDQAHTIDIGPLLGRAMGEFAANGFLGALADDALRTGRAFLERKKGRFEELVAERHRGWIRKAVDRQVARAIIDGVQAFIDDLLDPDSGARRSLLRAIEKRALLTMVEARQEASFEVLKVRLLEDSEIQAWVASAWNKICGSAFERMTSPSSKAREALASSISSAGNMLLNDRILCDKLNIELGAAIGETLLWREKLLSYITGTVRKWDAEAFSQRVELTVGTDLQYIRINGTAVGSLIGCMLYLAKAALQ
jgi:uncharacterized membrane-anchored protein YjiN (DUF445 family)